MGLMKYLQQVIRHKFPTNLWVVPERLSLMYAVVLRKMGVSNTHRYRVPSRFKRLFNLCIMIPTKFYFPLPNGPPVSYP
jgi:hypothetical protein